MPSAPSCTVLRRLAPSCAVLRCLCRLAPSAPAAEVAKICKSESWCEMMRNGARRCETVRYMARWCDMVHTVRMAQLYPEPPKVVNLQFGSPFSVERSPASSLWPWVGAQNGQMKAHGSAQVCARLQVQCGRCRNVQDTNS